MITEVVNIIFMENVQFEEEQQTNSFNPNRRNKMGAMTRFFIKLGLAKNQKQAEGVMLMISIVCILLMVYFIVSTFFPNLLNFSK